jgi:hypothetical protein
MIFFAIVLSKSLQGPMKGNSLPSDPFGSLLDRGGALRFTLRAQGENRLPRVSCDEKKLFVARFVRLRENARKGKCN